jgi:tetratricopeptide (TPR) repeat protein
MTKSVQRIWLSLLFITLVSLTGAEAFDNTNILVEEAVNHIYQKRYRQAHQTLKEAYEKSPRHPGVNFNLGRLFELTGNFEEALKEYRLAATLDTSMVAARRGIARCQVELKRIKAQQLQQIARQPEQPEQQPSVTTQPQVQTPPIVTQNPVRPAPQTQTRQPAPQRQPTTPGINLANADMNLPPLPVAVKQAASKSSGESRAEALLDSGKTNEALKSLEAILQKNPDSPQAHFLIGKALSLKGDLFGSIKHLEEALRVDEKFYDAYLLLGRNYAKVNLLEDAIKNYQLYYGVRPQASVALEIARIYESMGMPARAKEYYSRANVMNPGNSNIQTRLNESRTSLANDLYLRGHHAFSTNNFSEAVNLFSQAIETGGLPETAKKDALRKVEIARFRVREVTQRKKPARQGFKSTRKNFGTVNLKYDQLADIKFKTRFTGPVTVEWRGYIARKFSRYGRDFLLMIKELSQDELDMMNRDRNNYKLNKHFNGQPLFLLAANQGEFPSFIEENKMITFTGKTDWKTYNIINDMGQTVSLPSLDFISAYPDSIQ